MQEEVKKSFKGKTLKFYGHLEKEGALESYVGHIYCPWCSLRKDTTSSASLKKAAKVAFEFIETHWKMRHKDK